MGIFLWNPRNQTGLEKQGRRHPRPLELTVNDRPQIASGQWLPHSHGQQFVGVCHIKASEGGKMASQPSTRNRNVCKLVFFFFGGGEEQGGVITIPFICTALLQITSLGMQVALFTFGK